MKKILIATIVFLLGLVLFAQELIDNKVEKSNAVEVENIRDSIKSFLTIWLIDRDAYKAAAFFGNAAFKNDMLLKAPCATYIKHDSNKSNATTKEGIKKFLQEFLSEYASDSLDKVLNRQSIDSLMDQLIEIKPVNNPDVDLFILFKLSKEQLSIGGDHEEEYLKINLPQDFYVLFVPVGDGLIYFLWIREEKNWMIYHANLMCM